jgi:hypothetical protein
MQNGGSVNPTYRLNSGYVYFQLREIVPKLELGAEFHFGTRYRRINVSYREVSLRTARMPNGMRN